jgi:hypothetical protein
MAALASRNLREGWDSVFLHTNGRCKARIATYLTRTRVPSPRSWPTLGGARRCQPGTPIPPTRPARHAPMLDDVNAGRDRARSGVDAVRCRRDDLRPAGMSPYATTPSPPARSRRSIGTAQRGGRQAAGSWAVCRPAVVRLPRQWRGLGAVLIRLTASDMHRHALTCTSDMHVRLGPFAPSLSPAPVPSSSSSCRASCQSSASVASTPERCPHGLFQPPVRGWNAAARRRPPRSQSVTPHWQCAGR